MYEEQDLQFYLSCLFILFLHSAEIKNAEMTDLLFLIFCFLTALSIIGYPWRKKSKKHPFLPHSVKMPAEMDAKNALQ